MNLSPGRLAPGLAIAAVAALLAHLVAAGPFVLSPIVVAMVLGVVARNTGLLPGSADEGLALAAKQMLRLAVVLLGFRLAFGDLLEAGAAALGVVVAVVVTTLLFTCWYGRLLRLPRDFVLLTATGFAICGATAVAAVREVVDADDDAPAFAISLVTLFGTMAIFVLPMAAFALGLDAVAFGRWSGASVHDVGQVIATASVFGADALAIAVVVKLTRVLMLGPVVFAVGVWWRRSAGVERTASTRFVPLFVAGFAAAAALTTLGAVPDPVRTAASRLEGVAFTMALFGLGAGVRVARLRTLGVRGVLLGAVAFVFVALVALTGVVLVGP